MWPKIRAILGLRVGLESQPQILRYCIVVLSLFKCEILHVLLFCNPVIKDQNCTDTHSNCVIWTNHGECWKNPVYMLDNCCNACNYNGGVLLLEADHLVYCVCLCVCVCGGGGGGGGSGAVRKLLQHLQ